MNRPALVVVAGALVVLAVPAFAVPTAQPSGTVSSVTHQSDPAGSARDAEVTPLQTADATAIAKGLGRSSRMPEAGALRRRVTSF